MSGLKKSKSSSRNTTPHKLKMPAAFKALSNDNDKEAEVEEQTGGSTPKSPLGILKGSKSSPSLNRSKSNGSFSRFEDSSGPTSPEMPKLGNGNSTTASSLLEVETTNNEHGHEPSITESRRSASIVRSSMDLKSNKRSSSRDRYGFRKKTHYVSEQTYDEWWDTYEPYLKRRKKKWVKLVKESGLYTGEDEPPVRFPPKSEKLKRYVRKGIPAEWRGNAWFWFAKGHDQIATHPGLYDKLCRQTSNLKNNDTELIERDLQRTFPDNVYFRSPDTPEVEQPLIQALRRVLTCFSVYMPKIGYCQSLNFLAGMLLLFMDEEKAFWMLVIITTRYLPGVHEVNLEGVSIDQGVLVLCVKEALPTLWDKLGVNFEGRHDDNVLSNLPPITLCTTPWFMSGYIGVLPTETVLRVWDCFFFEESKVFFRIALTLLKMSEPLIGGMNDQMEVFQVIQNLPKKQIDASKLMETCFKRRNGFGHMSQQEIVRLRQFVHERRQKYVMAKDTQSLDERRKENNTTDLDEFKKLKPDIGKRGGLRLSKRMKSIRKRTSTQPVL